MKNEDDKRRGWKRRILRELGEYAINFVYLALFFGVFTWYRRLILAEYGIAYVHYGVALVEALVLAKIVMVGDVLGFGRKLTEKPLIFSTLYDALVFGLWVAVFSILEHVVIGFLRGEGLTGGVHELLSQGADELLARSLVTFFALIPFFAFREIQRVLGVGTVWGMFFRTRASTESGSPGVRTPPEQANEKK